MNTTNDALQHHHSLSSPLDYLVVGGGLTGLTLAHRLATRGGAVHLLERADRLGGQIYTHRAEGFVYESGPNTGMLSRPEVVELLNELDSSLLQRATPSAQRRLIYKGGAFRPLPRGLISAVCTPLFSWRDKLRILLEPWRKAGADPDEPVANLVRRRLGQSFYTYAVDPFIGGIYAGDAERLVTRHALPKLYALEQEYGSFVRGAIAKARQPKSERDRLATREAFSTHGGLESLIKALATSVGPSRVSLSAQTTSLERLPSGLWQATATTPLGTELYTARHIITTIGSQELIDLLPPSTPSELIAPLRALRYAPIVQVAVGYKAIEGVGFDAFGGLVPSCEDRELLGILNPSAGFGGRAPRGGLLLSVFLGGMRAPEIIELSDEAIAQLVRTRLASMLNLERTPDLLQIFRHPRAIPQYEASTDARLASIARLEELYPGLVIAGNMCDGIGIPDRIGQAYAIADRLSSGQ